MLSFDLQLAKDNNNLQESCKQHLLAASFGILKEVSEAAWSKTKLLQRQLNSEREKLFENWDEFAAKNIWRRVRRQMERLEFDLSLIARRKFILATPYNPEQQDTHHNPREEESRTKKRRFTRNRPFRNALIKKHSSRQASSPQGNHENLPDLHPINLTTCDLSDAERSLLTKGPAFCPTPKDVNWQKTIDDLDNFQRRIRLAVFHHGRSPDDNNHTADERLPTTSSTSNWMPPILSCN